MFRFPASITLLSLPLLPTLISAACAACDSYPTALRSCQTSSSSNVTAVGTSMDTDTIRCMCSSRSNLTAMNACEGCAESDPTTDVTLGPLFAWATTCQAAVQFGDKQAALCWLGQPNNAIPCFSNSAGGAAAGGSTSGGTTNRQSQPPTKSDAVPSLKSPSSFILALVAGFAAVIWLSCS